MNTTLYKWAIIEESLTDARILNDFQVMWVDITTEDDPNDRWHIYEVQADKETVMNLSSYIKKTWYYAHFWKWNDVIVVFPDKVIEFHKDDESLRKEAVSYWLSIDIPEEQLSFTIDSK